MYIYLFVIGVAVVMLAVLMLRFVQPELVYIVREQWIKVGINRVILEQEINRGKDHNERYNELTLKEFRYETLGHSAEYVLQRAGKIRELYSAMDTKRAESMPELELDRRPQVCIVELANLLRNMGEHLETTSEYDYKTIKADAILGFIILQISESAEHSASGERIAAPLPEAREVVDWFQRNPISIEQTLEVLLAAVYGLAYRLRVQHPDPSTVAGNILANGGGPRPHER